MRNGTGNIIGYGVSLKDDRPVGVKLDGLAAIACTSVGIKCTAWKEVELGCEEKFRSSTVRPPRGDSLQTRSNVPEDHLNLVVFVRIP